MSMLSGAQRAKHKQQRAAGDWYVETRKSVRYVFDHVRFTGPIHDPCCGRGVIPIVAREYGYKATGSDLADRGFGTSGIDFFNDRTPRRTLIFNPPGKGDADLFLLHALEVVARGEIALIVQVPFLCSEGRCYDLYPTRPPALVLPVCPRPSMPPGAIVPPDDLDYEPKGGTTDYAWFIWQIPHGDPRALLHRPPALETLVYWPPP